MEVLTPASKGLRRVLALCLGVWLAVASSIGWCKDDGQVVIEVQDGQTVRDIAATHLGDPDLWEEILRENDIGSVTDIDQG